MNSFEDFLEKVVAKNIIFHNKPQPQVVESSITMLFT